MRMLRIRGEERLTVLLFGLGLIGETLDRALRLRFSASVQEYPYDWYDGETRQDQRAAIVATLGDATRIAVVWSGGISGFGSSREEMLAEGEILGELIDWAQRLQTRYQVDFHLISSAGGLFEGQTHCTAASRPRPLRPYGEGKLYQEERLLSAHFRRRHIYRPSSVYGGGRSKRLGLATALAANALTGKTTRIMGNPATLRDYVLSDDIGRFMARRVVNPGPADEIMTMASGRPSSVGEMVELVRAKLALPMLVQFDPHPSNARHMSFLPSSLPFDWQPTALECGIADLVNAVRKRLS